MRTLDPAFSAHLATGATTLATCWRIVRTDGATLGFTDHDEAISFDGTAFAPASGLDGGEAAKKLGPQVDTSEIAGILASAAISEEDIELGRYDNATVETWRVNWRDVSVRDLRARATIGEITREDGLYRAELRSGQAALNIVKGRIYQALCDAELGDARCGVNLADPAFAAASTVAQVRDRYRIEVTGLEGFAEGWFGFGRLAWSSGKRIGLADRIVNHQRIGGTDILGFGEPVGDWVVPGDAATATAGCDRRFATCRAKFANALNFRGFPHIPGNDFVLAYPRPGSALDGEPLVT